MSTYENQTAQLRKLRQQFAGMPQLSQKAYAEAVETMRLTVHQFSTGRAGRTAAHVLLNAYNGATYPIDMSDIRKRDLDPTRDQLDGLKFQGRSSSIRACGWPAAMASSVALR